MWGSRSTKAVLDADTRNLLERLYRAALPVKLVSTENLLNLKLISYLQVSTLKLISRSRTCMFGEPRVALACTSSYYATGRERRDKKGKFR
jgi:hypothetical protein